MSLFSNPETHAANPPESWQVVKVADRAWRLTTKDGGVMEQFATRRAAEDAKQRGFLVDLYGQEGRWYRGEQVAGWKMYEPAH